MSQVILVLILAAAIVVGGGYILNGCTSTLADSAERIASVNSPQAQAAGNTAKLLGEVEATAQAIRVEVLTRAQAELQIERERELQAQSLQEQADAQEAQHAVIMADIETERVENVARASVAWVAPVATQAVTVLTVIGLVVVGMIGAATIRRMGAAWATKIEHQANVPLVFSYDRDTLTAPVILALVDGKLTMINPNTGEVLPLTQARNAEAARLRYLAIQNAIALQTRGNGARDGLIIPNVEAEVKHER